MDNPGPDGAAPFTGAMRTALRLAANGPVRGANPRVGCVVLDADGVVVGTGWHRGAGTEHAEVVALAEAGPAARGGTAVVTLEPCRHTGRTEPCATALVDAGIARVVLGAADPHPAASGGIEVLRRAGVQVLTGVLEQDCVALNRRWLSAVGKGRPHVVWKFAATLDGRSAAADGTSRWITGEAARADVHRRRAEVDAIVVGTGTVLADDPELTVRTDPSLDPSLDPSVGAELVAGQPLRVVVGLRDLPARARVLDRRGGAADTVHLRTRDPFAVLAALHEREVRTVWLEGGPVLAGAFWRAGLVDEVLAYVAPALLGAGRAAVGDLGVTTIDDAVRLVPVAVEQLFPDVLITADVRRNGHGHPREGGH